MTTMPITHSRAEAPETAETTGPSARRTETPVISELVVATLHLEHLAETADTPEDETTAHMNGITPEQQRSFVLANANRIRAALDKITASFEAPTPSSSELPAHHTAADSEGNRADGPLPNAGVPTAVEAFEETTALYAVLTGDREAARQIVTAMLPSERAAFADQLDELRKLLGPVCDNCGNLAEIGTSTTDPFSEKCRFLCSRCTAARRTTDGPPPMRVNWPSRPASSRHDSSTANP
ncbi:hypothetical protein FE633_13220 [Streptomyces montanus]|uniref:Uncharacterized protein n=1 Tax=Streptomyces montanus TaxID=2580423 RepID=A0A5R9FP65_9ACTN|nr:hypothetical protein [Streptomyces montanus]TLS45722.1 hypothetical protein FE633_13220 [Streptomyces montanus]